MPWAEYAVIHSDNGFVSVELCRVDIDIEEVRQAALASNMPEPTDWELSKLIPERPLRNLTTKPEKK